MTGTGSILRNPCAIVVLLAGMAQPALGQCPELVWSDEFDGSSVDGDKWEFQIGNGCSFGICGWGNEELQYYTPQNTVVEDGLLHIVARRQRYSGHDYTSSRLRTKGKAAWSSGRFEARMKLPSGQGIWPAFWMLPETGSWPSAGEIDVMELVGHEPEWVHGTIHFGDNGHQFTGKGFELYNGDFADDFHEFAIEREPGVIRWYVDGYLYNEVAETDLGGQRWPFDEPFHFLMNVAVGGRWPGNPDGTTIFPDSLSVDYVRVYDGTRASIRGPRRAAHGQSGLVYAIANLPPDANVEWRVPDDAAIVSGQGTAQATVRWGDSPGRVEAFVDGTCGMQRLAVDVRAGAPFVRDFSFLSFEGEDAASLGGRTTGTLEAIGNPDPTPANDSPTSGAYRRNPAIQYDVLYLEAGSALNAAAFVQGDQQFHLDLWTDAPVGTEVILQLENGALSAMYGYPQGRHSRFRAETSATSAWHRLVFEFLDRPHAALTASGVGTIVLLFNPDSHTGHTYVIDNFDAYVRQAESGIGNPYPVPRPNLGSRVTLHPNPFHERATLRYTLDLPAEVSVELFDVMGRKVRLLKQGHHAPGVHQVVLHEPALPAGAYLLRLRAGSAIETLLLAKVH